MRITSSSHRETLPMHRRGALLLYALLVMGAVIIGAVGLSVIMIDQVQQTRYVDESIVAYYAAESGMEELLQFNRRSGLLTRYPNDTTLLTNGRPLWNGRPDLGVSNSSWTATVRGARSRIYADIEKDSFAEVNLFDPDAPLAASAAYGTAFRRISITWDTPSGGCPSSQSPILEATLVSWNPGLTLTWSGTEAGFRKASPDAFCPPAEISLEGISENPYLLHKLRIRAKRAKLENVVVTAYDAAGNQLNLPGRLEIDVVGKYGNTQRRVYLSSPRGAPLSGLYDFVMFSECSLVKGGGRGTCPH